MEDPSFNVRVDEETGETIIAGMGELHLEIIIDRLKTEFAVDAIVGEPSVAYRETITTESTANHKYSKQTGGRGQYAHCVLRIEPNPGNGFEFVDHTKGGVIPQEYIPAIKRGIQDTINRGILADFPIVDVKVVVLDGSYHEVDSSEMAFRTCGSMCFKEAFLKAAPILLEPLREIEINTPDDHIGDVVGDLNRRRGRVDSMRRFRKGAQKINGFVPLKEMFGYANQLRNISSGRANYSMEFANTFR
jgi:elongation factor G